MVTHQEQVAEARLAARELTAAVDKLSRSLPDTIDLRRLVEDVARVSVDLDLLSGLTSSTPRASALVHDTEYDPRQFADGADEDPRRPRH
jgi:Tfp pilus assembly protein PilO